MILALTGADQLLAHASACRAHAQNGDDGMKHVLLLMRSFTYGPNAASPLLPYACSRRSARRRAATMFQAYDGAAGWGHISCVISSVD